MLAEGKYRARAVEWSQVTENERTGNEEIRTLFQITEEGPDSGSNITWRGYFTEGTAERTIESLRYMGWTGNDITDIQGLDANEVQLVIKHEEYEGKPQAKVAWVNRLAQVYMGQPMSADKKKAFAARMKGLVVASAQGTRSSPNPTAPATGQSDAMPGADFPFGANAPDPKPAQQRQPAQRQPQSYRQTGVKL
jgi:hypothetical protein